MCLHKQGHPTFTFSDITLHLLALVLCLAVSSPTSKLSRPDFWILTLIVSSNPSFLGNLTDPRIVRRRFVPRLPPGPQRTASCPRPRLASLSTASNSHAKARARPSDTVPSRPAPTACETLGRLVNGRASRHYSHASVLWPLIAGQ